MATYYPNTSSQTDVLSGPYVRRDVEKFTSYSEQPLLHGTMMMYLNPASSTSSFADISPGSSINPHNEMMFIPPTSDPMCIQTMNDAINQGTGQSIGDGGEHSFQGLSLSLSTQMSTAVSSASFQYQYYSNNPALSTVLSPHLPLSAENNEVSPSSNKELRNSDYFPYDMHGDGPNCIRFGEPNNNGQYEMNTKVMSMNQYQYEQVGIGGTVMRSKYLKATQQLLDEVVNVCHVLKRNEPEKEKNRVKAEEGYMECKGGIQSGLETNELSAGSGSSRELSPAERQELQGKLDKLHSLLDEVDKRYKHYCHQMQILVSSFDMVVGSGASKPYTALALKTISRHFRCLRDAITGQIQSTRKSLGEQDNVLGVIPRLRYVDQQLRQQRALQQFGMMRHAWRPQRGLPENAVTVLRAWLFEHFLHPYPKDSEKIMLARQTGLTRSQVANWFINARVRLWKPMIEEMYKEEFGEAEIKTRSPQQTPKPTREKSWGSQDRIDEEMHETTAASLTTNHDSTDTKGYASSGFHLGAFTSSENRGFYTNGSISNNGGAHVMVPATVGGYQIQELDSFNINNSSNQVSLALGLRRREGETNTTMGNGTPEFPYMEQVNQQQHRFGNPHILNDFVA